MVVGLLGGVRSRHPHQRRPWPNVFSMTTLSPISRPMLMHVALLDIPIASRPSQIPKRIRLVKSSKNSQRRLSANTASPCHFGTLSADTAMPLARVLRSRVSFAVRYDLHMRGGRRGVNAEENRKDTYELRGSTIFSV